MSITKRILVEEARAEASHLPDAGAKVFEGTDIVSERTYFLSTIDSLLADLGDDDQLDGEHAKQIIGHESGQYYEGTYREKPIKGSAVGHSVSTFGMQMLRMIASRKAD